MKTKKVRIKGKVHNVGYRLFLLSEAERLFIEKFDARNVLVNGEQQLIVLIEGAEERINRFVTFAESKYPPEASIESVEVEAYGEAVMSVDSFRQSFMVFQLTKIAQVGVGMLTRQDAMLTKQDKTIEILNSVKEDTSKMLEKQDETIKVIKAESSKMLTKQDKTIEILNSVKEDTSKMLEKQDETIEVIKEESEKTRGVLKEKIEEDVEWIKEEIIGIKATLSKVKEKVGVA